jgi:hypothetical protein
MNTKAAAMAVVGLMLIATNLFVISPMVMDTTNEALDDAVLWTNETWEDEDWQSSTLERTFFAWNLLNPNEAKDDLSAGQFERIGPFIYNVTAQREVITHDETAGMLRYSEYNEYEWCGDCTWTDDQGVEHESQPGDTQITNINILYDTQRIGALGTIISLGPDIVKGTFTREMLEIDLSERAPSRWVGDALTSEANSMGVENATMALFADGSTDWYLDWGHSQTPTTWSEDFTNLTHHVLYDAKDPGDSSICIAMTCDIGPMLMARLGAPDADTVLMRGSGNVSYARAELLGYVHYNNDGSVNHSETLAFDTNLYDGIMSRYNAHGGGADLTTVTNESLRARLIEMSGVSPNEDSTIQNLLFGWEDGQPIGMLVCDSQGFLCGITNLLLKAADYDLLGIQLQYGIGLTKTTAIAGDWASKWQINERGYEMILSGGESTIIADEWLMEAFGSKDPVTGDCITFGLNMPYCFWEISYGTTVDLEPAQSHNILYGDYALTGDFAIDFLYGEIRGLSVPMDENMMPAIGGTQHVWDDALVAQLYNIDENAAAALRWMIYDTLFTDNIGDLIESLYGVEPVLTMEVNNWLLGWEDPLVGWASLEKNATYYGCTVPTDGSDDDFCNTDGAVSTYTVYTGAVGDGEPGQTLYQDGTPYLTWRTPARDDATYGILGTVEQSGVVGTVFPAQDAVTMNLGGYAVEDTVVIGKDSIEGIDTYNHAIVVDPLENPIQAKLLAQESILDVFPNALPVYFGGTVNMQVEPNVNAVIGLSMDSYFFIDNRGISRGIGEVAPTEDDLQKVFQISIEKSIDEEGAETFNDKVTHNLQPYTYWTNFDTGSDAMYIDQVTAIIWLIGDLLIIAALTMVFRGGKDEWQEEQTADGLLEEE